MNIYHLTVTNPQHEHKHEDDLEAPREDLALVAQGQNR